MKCEKTEKSKGRRRGVWVKLGNKGGIPKQNSTIHCPRDMRGGGTAVQGGNFGLLKKWNQDADIAGPRRRSKAIGSDRHAGHCHKSPK